MAQFRGRVWGQKGEASRLGSKKSGLHVEANGWNIGADVTLFSVTEDGRERDAMEIKITYGSSGKGSVAQFRITEDMLTDANFTQKLRALFLQVG